MKKHSKMKIDWLEFKTDAELKVEFFATVWLLKYVIFVNLVVIAISLVVAVAVVFVVVVVVVVVLVVSLVVDLVEVADSFKD